MNVLMVGVDKKRIGGMWTVSENYLNSDIFNQQVNLHYVATSTCGSILKRIYVMLKGYITILYILTFYQIDLVHVHMAERGSVFRKGAVILLSRMFGIKIIIHLHAGPFIDWYKTKNKTIQKLITYIFKCATKIVVLGNYWKIQLAELIESSKIEVLYNGVTGCKSNPYNIDGEFVVFVGMLTHKKGIFDLIEAVKRIDKNKFKEKFVLCGYDFNNEVKKRITELHIEDRFILKGWIEQKAIKEIFKQTKLFVLPSYYEGLSMSVLESMCHGVPIITTNVSTMPELLGNYENLIQPGDVLALANKIQFFLQEKDIRRIQSLYIFNRANQLFSLKSNIQKTLIIYKECMRG